MTRPSAIPAPAIPTQQSFAAFEQVLHTEGTRAALAYLLGLTHYRFIGLFRFHDGLADAVIHCDRENPTIKRIDPVPEVATYCCYVRDGRGVFTTADSLADPRLRRHAARADIRSYCGVPLMTPEGELLGTLCHYDVVPRDADELDLALLLQVASALVQDGKVPLRPDPAELSHPPPLSRRSTSQGPEREPS